MLLWNAWFSTSAAARDGYFGLNIKIVRQPDYKAILFNELSREPAVYWGNVLKDDARPIADEETKGKVRRHQFGLFGK